jgi:Spy/CpxP family protein refolding chaperone
MIRPTIDRSTTRGVLAVVLMCTCVIVAATAGPAEAQQKRSLNSSGGMRKANTVKWWEDATVQEKLQLSADQVAAIATLHEAHQQRIKDIVLEQRDAYRSLIQNLDRLDETAEKRDQRRSDFVASWDLQAQANVDKWVALREILSFDQWKLLPETAPTALRISHLAVNSRGTIQVKQSSGD